MDGFYRWKEEAAFMNDISSSACNKGKLMISSKYPKHKNPKSIQEMGLYNLTMVISTGFTVGLNVNDLYFSIRFHYLMSNRVVLSERLSGAILNDLLKRHS